MKLSYDAEVDALSVVFREASHGHDQAESEDRRHTLKRRIGEVDAEIDRRVYALYGLTEEEIAVVEGNQAE